MFPKQEEVVHNNYSLRSGIIAALRFRPVGPSVRKSLSRISIPSGLFNYIISSIYWIYCIIF